MDSHERVRDAVMRWEALDPFGLTEEERRVEYDVFKDILRKATSSTFSVERIPRIVETELDTFSKTFQSLADALKTGGFRGLDTQMKSAFYSWLGASRFTPTELRGQKDLVDLRYPVEWFQMTRKMKRKFHLHVGPTNSGKTYHALKALEQSDRGVYGGPLRLLAHEVFTRLNNTDRKCMLVTGDERRLPNEDDLPADMNVMSCTVEMIDVNSKVDTAVIDEIQMIADPKRGWAWTQAVLGVQAKEVHLCGEERAVPIITALTAMMGDTLEIHRYERLTPLKMDSKWLGSLNRLRKGDCVVCFSILTIHALKRQIEQSTGRNVAIVYGSLPPETRAQQAALFNDPNNDYDFLVASDAIGMGLNLSIKRIVFESATKNDGGNNVRSLTTAEIKQIAGRAGRYRPSNHPAVKESNLDASPPEIEPTIEVIDSSGHPVPIGSESTSDMSKQICNHDSDAGSSPRNNNAVGKEIKEDEELPGGLVTTLYGIDYGVVKGAMDRDPEPINTAGIQATNTIIERFASYFPPNTPFSYILLRLNETGLQHPRFHLCNFQEQLRIADAIHSVEGLSINDRLTFCVAPSKVRDDLERKFLIDMAYCVANQTGGSLLDLNPEYLRLELLNEEVLPGRDYLKGIERLHAQITTYLWLSYRFTGVFTTRTLAFHVKSLVEKKFEQALSMFKYSKRDMKIRQEIRQKAILEARNKEMKQRKEDGDEEARPHGLVDLGQPEERSQGQTETESSPENGDFGEDFEDTLPGLHGDSTSARTEDETESPRQREELKIRYHGVDSPIGPGSSRGGPLRYIDM